MLLYCVSLNYLSTPPSAVTPISTVGKVQQALQITFFSFRITEKDLISNPELIIKFPELKRISDEIHRITSEKGINLSTLFSQHKAINTDSSLLTEDRATNMETCPCWSGKSSNDCVTCSICITSCVACVAKA
jgi:hypothetical protein